MFEENVEVYTQLIFEVSDENQSHYKEPLANDIAIAIAPRPFSKAFDTVPHDRLLHKLHHYGIRGNVLLWISEFLENRQQSVVIDGKHSEWIHMDSGVPQGTVLGPLLFLLHINDLPDEITSQTRLFADDCLVYKPIHSKADQISLQNDLDKLAIWANKWGMSFNPSKCNIMSIHRSKSPYNKMYQMCGQVLSQVDKAKYLGVTISEDLEWNSHITSTASKASRSLGFIKRNIKDCPQNLRETAYFSLVRSLLEYSCAVWDPHYKKDTDRLERVQRRAARFVKHDYKWNSSVTQMIRDLGWTSLAHRRKEIRLTLFYKIIHNITTVPTDDILVKADARTRSNHPYKYKHIRTSTNNYKFSFFPRTVPEWNSLDSNTINSDNIDTYKARLKTTLSQ